MKLGLLLVISSLVSSAAHAQLESLETLTQIRESDSKLKENRSTAIMPIK